MCVFCGAGRVKSCLDVCPGGRPRRLGVHFSHSLGWRGLPCRKPPLPGPRAQLGGRGAPVQPDWESFSLRPGQLFQKTRQTAGSSQASSQSPALAWYPSFHLLPVSAGQSRSLLSHKTFQGLPPLAGQRGLDTSASITGFYLSSCVLVHNFLCAPSTPCHLQPSPAR